MKLINLLPFRIFFLNEAVAIFSKYEFMFTGYYVEKRERGGEWVKVKNFPTPNTFFQVQGLHEGLKYEFRVIAINEAGPGKPSKSTDPIIAKAQKRKYLEL